MLTTVRLYLTIDSAGDVMWQAPQLAMFLYAKDDLETVEKICKRVGHLMMSRKEIPDDDYDVKISPTMINDVPFDDWKMVSDRIVAGYTVFVEWGVSNRDVENAAYERLRRLAAML